MKPVPLTQGTFALVDDKDYERVMKHKWRFGGGNGHPAAVRTARINGRRTTVLLSHYILATRFPVIDHADGDPMNNQRCNLRPCTRLQNAKNRKIQKHSSRYKGVSYFKATGKWQCSIGINGGKKHLGFFDDEREAAYAYDISAIHFYGRFARTNQQMGVL